MNVSISGAQNCDKLVTLTVIPLVLNSCNLLCAEDYSFKRKDVALNSHGDSQARVHRD